MGKDEPKKTALGYDLRLAMAKARLLPDSDVQALIQEAMTQNRMYTLPAELVAYAVQLYKAGKLTQPES